MFLDSMGSGSVGQPEDTEMRGTHRKDLPAPPCQEAVAKCNTLFSITHLDASFILSVGLDFVYEKIN